MLHLQISLIQAFLLIWLTSVKGVYGQEKAIFHFPEDYCGIWSGPLHVYKDRQKVRSFPMKLDIHKQEEGKYGWKLIYYVQSDSVVKDYVLIRNDSIPGHYVIDEKNGILLDGYAHGGIFVQRFEVGGSLLSVRLERIRAGLMFEILAGAMQPIRVSGDTIVRGEEIPPVQSFTLDIRQFGLLKRGFTSAK